MKQTARAEFDPHKLTNVSDKPSPAMKALLAVTALYHEYDQAAEMLKQNAKLETLCIGCGKCCEHNTPYAYGMEAANAVSYLLGNKQAYALQRRIEGWLLERHTGALTYEPLRGINLVKSGLSNKLRDEAIAIAKQQCPFYDSNTKLCLVHDIRPLVCRAYGVTRAAPTCSRPRSQLESETKIMYLGGEPYKDLHSEVDAALAFCDEIPKLEWKSAGFYPTLIYSQIWPKKFQEYVSNGLIATAKLVMTFPSMAVIFEDDADKQSLSDKNLKLPGDK